MLPCFVGDAAPELERAAPEPLPFQVDLWLLSHADVLRSRRVRMVWDFLYEALHARRSELEG